VHLSDEVRSWGFQGLKLHGKCPDFLSIDGQKLTHPCSELAVDLALTSSWVVHDVVCYRVPMSLSYYLILIEFTLGGFNNDAPRLRSPTLIPRRLPLRVIPITLVGKSQNWERFATFTPDYKWSAHQMGTIPVIVDLSVSYWIAAGSWSILSSPHVHDRASQM